MVAWPIQMWGPSTQLWTQKRLCIAQLHCHYNPAAAIHRSMLCAWTLKGVSSKSSNLPVAPPPIGCYQNEGCSTPPTGDERLVENGPANAYNFTNDANPNVAEFNFQAFDPTGCTGHELLTKLWLGGSQLSCRPQDQAVKQSGQRNSPNCDSGSHKLGAIFGNAKTLRLWGANGATTLGRIRIHEKHRIVIAGLYSRPVFVLDMISTRPKDINNMRVSNKGAHCFHICLYMWCR